MEGIRSKGKKLINQSKRNPHVAIFILLLCLSTSLNSILISSMGLPIFLDSLMRPNDYEIVASEQFKIASQTNPRSAVLIQKQTHPSFSVDQKDTLCSMNLYGLYSLEKPLLVQNESIDSTEIIGKVITFIPPNSIDNFAFAWWQQTKGFIQHLQS